MQEATGTQAATLHRLLEYSYDEDEYNCYFRRNEENPLDADAVIVDEVSMLDVYLLSLIHIFEPEAEHSALYEKMLPVFDHSYHALCGVYDEIAGMAK